MTNTFIDARLYTKPGCHLCEEMKQALSRASRGIDVRLEEVDISGDEELLRRFGEEIPVLFIGGRKAFKYRASERALRERLVREISALPERDKTKPW